MQIKGRMYHGTLPLPLDIEVTIAFFFLLNTHSRPFVCLVVPGVAHVYCDEVRPLPGHQAAHAGHRRRPRPYTIFHIHPTFFGQNYGFDSY